MAILTKQTISKGQANEFDLSKSDLAAVSKVVNDSYFSDQTNWSKVIVEYKSAEGNQHEMVIFDASEASPKGNFEVSEKARDSWEVQSVKIMDFDGGYLKLGRGDLTVENFDIALGSVGGDVGAIYTAFNYLNTIKPDGLEAYDYFGTSVAISGDYIVVGAMQDDGADNTNENSGAAYVFKINDDSIILLKTLRPMPNIDERYFGTSVAISGDYIVVSGGRNAAHVYKINGNDVPLLQTLRLTGTQDYSDYFGDFVAISGNHIVLGAKGDDGVDNSKRYSGAAYVYKINDDDSIILLKTLRPDGLEAYDGFGQKLAISGDYIVVGSWQDDGADNTNDRSGAAYVFKINGNDVQLLHTLRPDGLHEKEYFGASLAISGNHIVVGSRNGGADNSKFSSGAAYVYKINDDDSIILLKTLRPDELEAYDMFGTSVAISGDYIVVGTPYEDGVGNSRMDSGAAYVFKINDDDIPLLQTLRSDDPYFSDYLGVSVAMGSGYICLGKSGDDASSGAVYIFKGVE